MADQVTMDAKVARWLVIHALADLHGADQDGEGCCVQCCGPCGALAYLAATGQLDDLVREQGPDYFWWKGGHDGEVDRDFLVRAWRMTDCHE